MAVIKHMGADHNSLIWGKSLVSLFFHLSDREHHGVFLLGEMRGDGTFGPVSATEQHCLILVAALIIPYHRTSNQTGSKDPRLPHAALAPVHDHLSQGFSWSGLEEFGETALSLS